MGEKSIKVAAPLPYTFSSPAKGKAGHENRSHGRRCDLGPTNLGLAYSISP
jgi:hypothetical protein